MLRQDFRFRGEVLSRVDSTVAEEVRIGRRYSPEIAWPTIRLALGVYVGLAASTWSALSGYLPYWLAGIVNAVILYGSYTVVHEAVHGNIVPRDVRLRWLNKALGYAICPLLWLFFHPHKRSHTVHHTRCNSDEDPDIYARGKFGVVAFWRIPLAALSQLSPFTLYRECTKFEVPSDHRLASYLTYALYLALVGGVILAGHGYALLVLWFIPWLIGYSVMLVFFTWVPHHPHSETGRYRNTRCSVWRGANLLTQGQHMHLIHHMMPWIPYYQYETVFHEVRPFLVRHSAPIDGFWPRVGKSPA
jgi:fatty acid desaturase